MEMEVYRHIIKSRGEMLAALNNNDRKWNQTACISIVYPTMAHISTNQACHAGLRDITYVRGYQDFGSPIAVVSALMKPYEKEMLLEEEAFMYLDWLLNRSPYSSVFISKDVHECLLHKAIIADANHPSNLMAGGLVASRRLWEYPTVARVFCDLVKEGTNEDLAYILAHYCTTSFDRSGKVDWSCVRGGHCTIETSAVTQAYVKNFLAHTPTDLNKPYSESYSYYGYSNMFLGKGPRTIYLSQWILSLIHI